MLQYILRFAHVPSSFLKNDVVHVNLNGQI